MFFENCCFLSSVVFWNLMFVSFVIIFWNMLFSKIWNLLLFNSVVFSDLLLLGSTLICCHQVVVAYFLQYFKSRHIMWSSSCLFSKIFQKSYFFFCRGAPPLPPPPLRGGPAYRPGDYAKPVWVVWNRTKICCFWKFVVFWKKFYDPFFFEISCFLSLFTYQICYFEMHFFLKCVVFEICCFSSMLFFEICCCLGPPWFVANK